MSSLPLTHNPLRAVINYPVFHGMCSSKIPEISIGMQMKQKLSGHFVWTLWTMFWGGWYGWKIAVSISCLDVNAKLSIKHLRTRLKLSMRNYISSRYVSVCQCSIYADHPDLPRLGVKQRESWALDILLNLSALDSALVYMWRKGVLKRI